MGLPGRLLVMSFSMWACSADFSDAITQRDCSDYCGEDGEAEERCRRQTNEIAAASGESCGYADRAEEYVRVELA
jgi:hypothetical protein